MIFFRNTPNLFARKTQLHICTKRQTIISCASWRYESTSEVILLCDVCLFLLQTDCPHVEEHFQSNVFNSGQEALNYTAVKESAWTRSALWRKLPTWDPHCGARNILGEQKFCIFSLLLQTDLRKVFVLKRRKTVDGTTNEEIFVA